VKNFFRLRSRSLLITIVLFAGSFSSIAQTTKFDRPRTYDVKNYVIRVSFDRAKKTVYGDTTVQLTPLNSALSDVALDAVGMNFTEVTLDPSKANLAHNENNGQIDVKLDRSYSPGEMIAIRFVYTIKDPKKGIYFIDAETSPKKFLHPAQIWTQNEAEDGRYWFPSFDFPSDKATSEEFITVPKSEVAVGNGKLIDTKPNADGTQTFHFKMDVPYSTYLTSFVVGDFARLSDKHNDTLLGFYAYKDRQKVAGQAFSKTKEMMANFEAMTGIPFPFAKYDQIMVSGFSEFDGMENITATTLSDTNILFAEYPFGKGIVEDLVSHELSHSWFGDMVTCRNWSELWLNEGFATFMEAATREKLYGRENYIHKLIEDRDEFITDDAIGKKRHALRNETAKPDNSLFDITTYQKGGLVIHMLRETVGDAAFWKGVNLYLNRHKFDTVVSSDLQAAMEEASGKKLQWFFDQWVYATGYPKVEISYSYNADTGNAEITINQIQKEDGTTPAAFNFPLDVALTTSAGPVSQTLNITKRSEIFPIKVSGPPTKIEVDRLEKVILKSVKLK
jgi:aminopeptidase N